MRVFVHIPDWSPPDNEITNREGVSNALKGRMIHPASMVNMRLWHNAYVLMVEQDTTVSDTRILVCRMIDETGPMLDQWALFYNGSPF